jgi:hypothetical protein
MDGLNLYKYTQDNPNNNFDAAGTQSEPSQPHVLPGRFTGEETEQELRLFAAEKGYTFSKVGGFSGGNWSVHGLKPLEKRQSDIESAKAMAGVLTDHWKSAQSDNGSIEDTDSMLEKINRELGYLSAILNMEEVSTSSSGYVGGSVFGQNPDGIKSQPLSIGASLALIIGAALGGGIRKKAVSAGRKLEDRVRKFLVQKKPTKALSGQTARGLKDTIPDIHDGVVADVKDVKGTLSFRSQLQAQWDIAKREQKPFSVIVGPKTSSVSQPLSDAVRSSGGLILRINRRGKTEFTHYFDFDKKDFLPIP